MQTTWLKNGPKPSSDSHQSRYTHGKLVYEKVLRVIGHQGNESENSETPLQDYHRDQNPERWQHQLLTVMWNRDAHTLLVGMQTGIATLEVWGIFFYKIKHILIRVIQLSCSLIFIQRHVYKSVVQNCQILEANSMSFRRKRDKLWHI